jgi:hypothetical protein
MASLGRLAVLAIVACRPWNPSIDPATAARATRGLEPACRSSVRAALEVGESVDTCARASAKAQRRVAIREPGARYGTVDGQKVDLRQMRLVLGEARSCARRPLRRMGESVVRGAVARQAGCAIRPYEGPIEIAGIDEKGVRSERVLVLAARSGVLLLDFARVDHLLRRGGRTGLDVFDRLELGRDGWAGTVNLERLREFQAAWHTKWVEDGRGSPGLLVHARPPTDPFLAETLSVEARLGREERDYLEVARGALSPAAFLDRHIWSPYRASVLAIESGRGDAFKPPAETR